MGLVKSAWIWCFTILLFVACDKMDKLGLQPGPEQAAVEAFKGVKNLTQTADGKYVLKWDVPANLNNANYKIYLHQYKDKSALSNLPASSVDASENPLSGIGLLQLSDDKAPVKLGNLISTIPDAASFTLDFSLETGITYAFQVRMVKEGVTDANSTVLVYTPSSAKLNFAGITDGQITSTGKLLLNWEMPTDVGDVMMNDISYEIYMDATPLPLQQTIVGSLAINGAGLAETNYDNGKVWSFKAQSLPSYANAPIAKISGKRFFQYDEELLNGKTYIFHVKAKGPNKEQDNNNKVFVYRAGLENLEPFIGISELTSPNHGEVSIKWQQSANKDVVGYKIYGEDLKTPVKVILDAEATSFEIVDLTPNAKVSYMVRAVDKNDREDSNTRRLTVKVLNNQLPSFLGVSLVKQQNTSDIAISWQPATGQPKEYRIYQVAKPVGSAVNITDFDFSTPLKTVLAPSMGVILNNAGDDQAYHFVVRAAVAGGAEEQNTVIKSVNMADNGAPIFEGIQTITSVSGAIKVGWTAAKGQVSNYKVYASTNPATLFQAVNFKVSTEGTLTQATVSDLGDNATWYLGVRAIDRHNQEDSNSISKSLTVGDMTPPIFLGYNAPGVSAVAINETKLNLMFKRSSDSDVSFYSVKVRKTGSSQALSQVMTVTQPANGDITTQINGLLGNTAYDVLVNAVDSSGNVSTNTATVSATTADLTPPSFLGVKTVTRDTANAPLDVVVKWDKPLANDAVAYRVYYAKQAFSTENFSKANTYPLTVNGVTISMKLIQDASIVERKFRIVDEIDQGTTYYFMVRSTDAAGNEDTNTAQISYVVPTVTPPVFNGLASATLETGTRDVLLQWTEPTGSNSAASYLVYYSTTPNNPRVWSDPIPVAAPATSYKVTQLTELQTYYFKVYARNIEGIADTNQQQRSALILDITPPVFNGIASIVNDSDTQTIKINFARADDSPGLGVKDYRVYWREIPDGSFPSAANKVITHANACGVSSCQIALDSSDGLVIGKSYEFRVDAADLNIPTNVLVSSVKRTHLFPSFVAPTNLALSINGGDASTAQSNATLTIQATNATEMYITNTAGCGAGGNWEAFATTKSWILGQNNATATVYIKFRDAYDNVTSCINDTIIHDTQIPTNPSVSINNNAAATGSTNVTLSLAATDLSALQMYITNVAGCASGGTWETWSATKAWTLGQTDTTATVYVKFKDILGYTSSCVSDSILHDATPPASTSISINNDAAATNATAVTLNLAATDLATMQMYITNNATCNSGGVWEDFATTKSWTLGQTNATAMVYVKFRDEHGNVSSCINDTIIHDGGAPTGTSISIDSGAANTNSATVNLTLAATDTQVPLSMYITNTASCASGGSWETFATTKTWTLDQSNTVATVYVKFKDAVGNESACINDTILHDNTPPASTSIVINGNANSTALANVTLTLAATDQTAIQMYITDVAGCASGGTWEAFNTTKSWTLSSSNNSIPVYVKFRDVLNQESACINDTIIHDSAAPTATSISINAGAEATNTTAVTLTLAATDLTSVQMYVTNTAFCAGGGAWEAFNATKSWTLTTSNNTNTVYVKFKDFYGNESSCVSDTIIHDQTAPAFVSVSINAAATVTNLTAVTLTLAASDLSSMSMYITNMAACAEGGTWEAFNATKTWTLLQTNATATVYVKFKDAAGNESSCVNDTITHDSIPPTADSFAISNGALTTDTMSVTLNLASTGASQMYITNTLDCTGGGAWETYATTKAWTLVSGGGANINAYAKFRDAAGNESNCVSDSIINATIYWNIPLNSTSYTSLGDNLIYEIFVDANNIYACTGNGGLSVSADSGQTWRNLTTSNGLPSNSIRSMAKVGSTIYLATSDGLAISTNNGNTWTTKIAGINLYKVIYDTSTLYIGTVGNGLSISTDGGTSFTSKSTAHGLGGTWVYDLTVVNSILYVGTSGGLSISSDNGATWTNKTTTNGLGSNTVYGVYVNGSTIYAATSGGLSISVNAGSSFTNLTTANGLASNNIKDVNVIGSTIFVGTYAGLSYSTNGGSSFTTLNTTNGLVSNDINNLIYYNNTYYIGTNSKGISISTNNLTSFTNITAPSIPNTFVNEVFAIGTNYYVATVNNGLYISTNSGLTWTNKTVTNGLGWNNVLDIYVVGNSIYAATGSGLSISTDHGSTWVNKTTASGLGNNAVNGVHVDNGVIYAATSGGLSISTDGGASFSNKTTAHGLVSNGTTSVYASGSDIFVANSTTLSKSSDGGSNFSTSLSPYSLCDINKFDNKLFAANCGGLGGAVVSTNNGSTWTQIGNGSSNSVYITGSTWYQGTTTVGLRISTDGGSTFTTKNVTNGLPSLYVTSVYLVGATLLVGTSSGLAILNPLIPAQ